MTETDNPRKRSGSQRGVTAVVVAISMMLLAGAGALGFDISRLVFARQQLRNAIDAAAQAVAVDMPVSSKSAGDATAKKFAMANDPNLTTSDIQVNYFCVVTKAADGTPTESQIPSTCNPGTKGVNWLDSATALNGKKQCPTASKVCAIPCVPSATVKCNAVQVTASRVVQFIFGPAINIPTGTTGAMSTVSCRGTCGGEAAPNPMNVVVMADRTPSMSSSELSSMKSGLASMLGMMTPTQQYVAFGAIAISTGTGSSGSAKISAASGTAFQNADFASFDIFGKTTWSSTGKSWRFNGSWVPIGFSKAYTKLDTSGTKVLDTSTQLGSAVSGLPASGASGNYPSPWHLSRNTTTGACGGSNGVTMTSTYTKTRDCFGQALNNFGNTHLASAMKGAARYLLSNVDSSGYVSGLDDGTRAALGVPPKNVIVFETDGSPVEVFNSASASLSLSNDFDIGATSGTSSNPQTVVQKACDNFASVAAAAKAKGITIITIGYGDVNSSNCGSSTTRSVMAAAASTQTAVTGSGTADSQCSTPDEIAAENSDTDLYYCAASADDLKSVFAAAMGSLTGGTKFMAIDGFGD